MTGMAQRCVRDMRALLPPSSQPVVVSRPEYMPGRTMKQSVWMGGAVLAKVLLPCSRVLLPCASCGNICIEFAELTDPKNASSHSVDSIVVRTCPMRSSCRLPAMPIVRIKRLAFYLLLQNKFVCH